MVTLEVTNDEGLALLTCMNYLFASIQDLESIADEQKKKDAELEYYRSIAMMQSISDEQMKNLIDKLEELRLSLIKIGEDKAAEVSVVEMVEDVVPPIVS